MTARGARKGDGVTRNRRRLRSLRRQRTQEWKPEALERTTARRATGRRHSRNGQQPKDRGQRALDDTPNAQMCSDAMRLAATRQPHCEPARSVGWVPGASCIDRARRHRGRGEPKALERPGRAGPRREREREWTEWAIVGERGRGFSSDRNGPGPGRERDRQRAEWTIGRAERRWLLGRAAPQGRSGGGLEPRLTAARWAPTPDGRGHLGAQRVNGSRTRTAIAAGKCASPLDKCVPPHSAPAFWMREVPECWRGMALG